MFDKFLGVLVVLVAGYALISWYGTYRFNLDCKASGGQAVRTLSFETICIPEGVLMK